MEREKLIELRMILQVRFNESELRTLCFDLGVDYDSLPGLGKADKARELVYHCERYSRIADLVDACKRLRLDISWEPLAASLYSEKPYHKLPQPDYIHFVGREEEMSRLCELLSPDNRAWIIVVDGVGGIGKSALALEVAHRCLREYERVAKEKRFEAIVWTSAKSDTLTADGVVSRRQVTSTLDDIYKTIAQTLEREEITQAAAEIRDDLVCRALAKQRTLLIVDNLETIDDERVNNFLRDLPAPTKAIVTTRYRVDVAYPIRLTGMPEENGLALIRQECDKKKVDLSEEEVKKLYRRTGGVPLAIVWSVALMGLGHSPEAVLHRLGEPSSDIAQFCFEGTMEHIRGDDAHKLAMALSLFPSDASREALGQVTGFGKGVLSRDEGLATLEKLSLVNKRADRFWLLPLTRSYLEHEAWQVAGFAQGSFERMVKYYRQLVSPSKQPTIEIPYWEGLFNYTQAESLQKEWNNLTGLIRWALDEGHKAIALDLFLPVVHLMNIVGLRAERLQLSEEMCQVASERDKQTEMWLRIDAMGYILRDQERRAECIHSLEAGRMLARQFGVEDALVLADAYEASLYARVGEESVAQEKLDALLERADPEWALEHGTPLNRLVARRLANVAGSLRRSRKDFLGAKEWFELELELRQSIGESSAGLLAVLASVCRKLNDLEQAEEFLSQALTVAEHKFNGYINYELARLAEEKGEFDRAREFATLALEQYFQIGRKGGVLMCQKLLERLPG